MPRGGGGGCWAGVDKHATLSCVFYFKPLQSPAA